VGWGGVGGHYRGSSMSVEKYCEQLHNCNKTGLYFKMLTKIIWFLVNKIQILAIKEANKKEQFLPAVICQVNMN
jgi:hypothetical protein